MDGKIEVIQHQHLERTPSGPSHGPSKCGRWAPGVFEINPQAERRLRTKIDLYIVPTVALLYLFCFIDRINIGNARLAGFEKELGLVGNDYNTILSIFYVSYALFEIPATLTCKWMGPGWFLPLTTVLFGLMSVCTGFVHNKSQALGVRFLLGICEAGLMPGVAYYLSRWYRRAELAFRLAMYMVMAPLAGAFGGLFASAILKIDHFGIMSSWRTLFGFEGLITIILGLLTFLTLTDRPETARWLNEDEKRMAIARVAREHGSLAVVYDRIDRAKIIRGITNPVTLSTAVIFLFNNITALGVSFFMPTIVKTICPDSSTVQLQLLSVPPYVVGAVFTIVLPSISWWADRRQIILIASAPTVIIGYIMFLSSLDAHVRYAAIFLIASTLFSVGAMANANVSANVVSDTARSMAIGTNVMFGYVGGLIATWTFMPSDSPRYVIGNSINLACSALLLITATGNLFWMKYDNKKRDEKWAGAEELLAGPSEKEQQDLDWKHPNFRWKP